MARRIRCPHCLRTFKTPTTDAKKGGLARAKALTPEERLEIARIAAQARWGHHKA